MPNLCLKKRKNTEEKKKEKKTVKTLQSLNFKLSRIV